MSLLENKILKVQFKLDQLIFPYRVAVLSGSLLVLCGIWLFFIYSPQASQMKATQKKVAEQKSIHLVLSARNRALLEHVETGDMKSLIEQYNQLKTENNALDEEIKRHRYRYVSDKVLAELLHSLLKDVSDISVEHFSTVVSEKAVVVKSSAQAETTPPKVADAKGASEALLLSPKITRYTLSLKGNYSSITKFLQRIEQLKWQLFWIKFTYHVEKHPEATAVIEFYTLKEPPAAPVASEGKKT